MPLYVVETLGLSPNPAQTLSVLAEAMGGRVVEEPERVSAHDNSNSPDEGLTLLTAYVAISDRRVRQALLDTVLTIAGVEPPR